MHHLTYINNLLHLGWRIYDSGTILFDSLALFIKKKKQKDMDARDTRDLQNQRMIGTADLGLLSGCFPGLLIEMAPLTETICDIEVATIGSQRTRLSQSPFQLAGK